MKTAKEAKGNTKNMEDITITDNVWRRLRRGRCNGANCIPNTLAMAQEMWFRKSEKWNTIYSVLPTFTFTWYKIKAIMTTIYLYKDVSYCTCLICYTSCATLLQCQIFFVSYPLNNDVYINIWNSGLTDI